MKDTIVSPEGIFLALREDGEDFEEDTFVLQVLSHALRQSTIGAGALNVRVRNGIVCNLSAITTRSTKREINTK